MKKWIRLLCLIPLMLAGPVFAATTMTSVWYWTENDRYSKPVYPVTRAAVQAVLDKATATESLYIQFGIGRLETDSTLWVHGTTSLYGFGMGISEIKRTVLNDSYPANTGATITIAPYGLHSPADSLNIQKGIEFKGLTINGNASAFQSMTNSAPHQDVVYAPYVDGLRLESVRIKQSMRSGIFMQECRNAALYGCEFDSIGNWTVSATQNAIDFYNSDNRASSEGHGKGLIVDGFRITNVMPMTPAEAISLTNASDVVINNGFVDGCDRVIEIQGSANTWVDSNFVFSNIVAVNIREEGLTIGSGAAGRRIVGVSLTNSQFSGHPTLHTGRILSLLPSSASSFERVKIIGNSFKQINTENNNNQPYFDITPGGTAASTDLTITGNTIVGGNMAANNHGIQVRGNLRRVLISGNILKDIPGVGITSNPTTNQLTADVKVEGNILENIGNDGMQFVVNDNSNGILRSVEISRNEVIDACRTQGSNGIRIGASSAAGGGEVSHSQLSGNLVRKATGANPSKGIEVIDGVGGTTDSISVYPNDVYSVPAPYNVSGSPTNVTWLDPQWSATISRLGPYSTATTGGAIRIVDGVKFPLTGVGLQAAVDEVGSAGGGTVVLPAQIIESQLTIWLPSNTALWGTPGVSQIRRSAMADGDANNTGAVIACGPSVGTLYTIGSPGRNISIYGVTANGNAVTFAGITNANLVPKAIRFDYVDGVRLDAVTAYNALGTGIEFRGCRNVSGNQIYTQNVGQSSIVNLGKNGVSLIGDAENGWGNGYNLTNLILKGTGDEAIMATGIDNLSINGVVADTCDFVFEVSNGITSSGYTARNWSISNVTARNVLSYFVTFNTTVDLYSYENLAFSNLTMSGDPTLHDGGAIAFPPTAGRHVDKVSFSNCVFSNINTKDTTTRHWVDSQVADTQGQTGLTLTNCKFYGKPGSTRTGTDIGINLRGSQANVNLTDILLKDVPGTGMRLNDYAAVTTPGMNDVTATNVMVDGANDWGFRITGTSASSTITYKNIKFIGCKAKNTNKVAAGAGFDFQVTQAGVTLQKVVLDNCRAYSTTSDYGLRTIQSAGTFDDLAIQGCDFEGNVTGPYVTSGTITNVRWMDPRYRLTGTFGSFSDSSHVYKRAMFEDTLRVLGPTDLNNALDVQLKGAFGDSLRANKGLYVGGQFVNKILRGSATLDFDLTAVTCQTLTVTVNGAADGDEVFVGAPNGSIVADETITAWVSAANTVSVRACDGALAGNPASGTYKITVVQ